MIAGLGNPGPEYEGTRHNVGWWLLEELADAWGLGRFKRESNAGIASGRVGPHVVRLVKPLTYMNRSGAAVGALRRLNAFDITQDLLVIVDDVALDPGRVRFRPAGSAGGHNGLKSIESVLGTQAYARLRIGVGAKPPAMDLADWVLGTPSKQDRQAIRERFPQLVECVGVWLEQGIEPAMNTCNG